MKIKTKRVGICRREIITPEVKDAAGDVVEKAVLGPLSLTDGDVRSAIRSALRRLWNSSAQRVFLETVRFREVINNREVWAVKCTKCSRVMGISEKAFTIRKDGSNSSKKRAVFDVDHLNGNPRFEDMENDLGAWAHNLFNGKLRILCKKCHKERTEKQAKRPGRQNNGGS